MIAGLPGAIASVPDGMASAVLVGVNPFYGRLVEHAAPEALPSDRVTVLDVYGSLPYAGARTLQARLPGVGTAHRAVVVLRLRGHTSLGATFNRVIGDYSRRLAATGGRLYLSGLSPNVIEQLRETGALNVSGPVSPYRATSVIGESTARAADAAEAWLIRHRE